MIGLSSFTDYGTLLLLNELNLDGYPSYLLIADVDADGTNEAILSGENFNGITIISEDKFVLKGRKIFENRVFSSPVILDLDYDSYPDIAAFDILNNSLVFLINDRTGNFKIIRSLAVEGVLDNIKVFDFNKDHYDDLITSSPGGVSIFYGDSVSSFNNQAFIETPSQPGDIEIGDFNSDKLPDISFFSKESRELYLIIQKSEADHFFDPILLSVFPEGEDLTKIKTGNVEKLALLNNNGKIALIKRMKGIQDSSVLKMGGIPNFIRFFNMDFKQKPDILFVDDWNNTLNILRNFGQENWRNYFTFKLSGKYSNFYLDNSSSSTLNVFAYSDRSRLIEKVGISFNENNAHRSKFYTKGSIYDLKYKKEESLNSDKLTVLSSSQKELLRENILMNGDQFSSISIDSIDSDVVDAVFSSSQNDNLYYWVKSGNSLFFKKFNTSAGNLNREILYKIELSNESKVQVITIPLRSKIFHPDAAVCILSINNKSNLLFYDGKTVRGKNPKFEELGITTLQKHFIHIYRNPYSNREFLFFYDPGTGKLYRTRLLKNFLEWTTRVVLESKNPEKLFPGKFSIIR